MKFTNICPMSKKIKEKKKKEKNGEKRKKGKRKRKRERERGRKKYNCKSHKCSFEYLNENNVLVHIKYRT